MGSKGRVVESGNRAIESSTVGFCVVEKRSRSSVVWSGQFFPILRCLLF
jgi:hypothetical protein